MSEISSIRQRTIDEMISASEAKDSKVMYLMNWEKAIFLIF